MSKASAQPLWADLPRAEQEAIKKGLEQLHATSPIGPARADRTLSGFKLIGYVRCDLANGDKPAFLAWEAANRDGRLDQLVKAVDSGYLVKCGEGKEGYQASLSAATTGKTWDGYVLTAWAGTPDRAISLLLFKHLVLLSEDWTVTSTDETIDFMR